MSPLAIISIAAFFYILGRFFAKRPHFEQDYDEYCRTPPKFSYQKYKNTNESDAINYTLSFVFLLVILLFWGNEFLETEVTIALK